MKLEKIKTGINELDTMLNGGIFIPSLVFIGGLKESGKTILIKKLINNMSEHNKCQIHSLEENPIIFAKDIKNTKNIFISTLNDIEDIEKQILISAEKGVKLFFIDSVLRINKQSLLGNNREKISNTYSRLHDLKNDLGIIIFIVISTTKDENIFASVESEHDADIWLQMHSKENGLKEVSIIKNKYGFSKKHKFTI